MAQKLTALEFDKKFIFEKEIGAGSFGSVFQYKEIDTEKQWAVKKIICNEFEDLSTSIQELTLLSRAVHKNVIQIKYYCMIKDQNKLPGGNIKESYSLFLFMELGQYSLDFEIVERFKNKHYYSDKSIFFITSDIASALYYLQKIKLSHRDIKPHNIVKVNKIYKLTDFGVSKHKQNINKNNTVMGSPPYLSPFLFEKFVQGQQLAENNSYKSDAFSLGLVILGCVLLKDISGCNSKESLKDEKINEVKNTKRHGEWLITILINLLEYNEEKRWDFVQLYNFIKQVSKQPEIYGLNISQKQIQNNSGQTSSFQNSPNTQFAKLSDMIPTLQDKTITSDYFNMRNDSINNNSEDVKTIKCNEEQKEENPKKIEYEQEKFVIQEVDEDEYDLLVGMSSAQTFVWKKQKFQEKKNIIEFPEGQYLGNIDENKMRQGQGEFLSKQGTFYYKGEWKNDQMEGKGDATWDGGKKYSGDWVNSQRHGYGIQNYSNGDIYKGEFFEDLKHGKGQYQTYTCEKYTGDYKYGDKEGYGIYEYNNGTVYEGNWKSNLKQGKGSLKNIKGEIIYEGQFKNNKYNGIGKLCIDSKQIYEGEFKNNLQHGQGKIYKKKTPEKFENVVFQNGKQIIEN